MMIVPRMWCGQDSCRSPARGRGQRLLGRSQLRSCRLDLLEHCGSPPSRRSFHSTEGSLPKLSQSPMVAELTEQGSRPNSNSAAWIAVCLQKFCTQNCDRPLDRHWKHCSCRILNLYRYTLTTSLVPYSPPRVR